MFQTVQKRTDPGRLLLEQENSVVIASVDKREIILSKTLSRLERPFSVCPLSLSLSLSYNHFMHLPYSDTQ